MTAQRRVLFALILASVALMTSGCAGALMMPFYLINGTDAPPVLKNEVKSIPKESTMVVICRSNLNLYGSSNPDSDLSQALTYCISTEMKDKKKKKLTWIPYDRVEDLFDEEELHNLSFEKLGAKLKADYVIGVEIDSFDVHHSSQFYQGTAKTLVRLIDVNKHETIARQSMPTYTYPPTPVPVSDYDEIEFQKTFTVKLAKNIATLFCPHDPHEQYAVDSDFPER
ncbi:MAG: hypothetical protein Q4G03_08795 [Planctomycetia bacterium]|nr:hypothetical protein [Planctomycetia bacterium]